MNKEKTKISAQVVADSLSPQGDRLTSLLITFPRIILSELLTHRMLSKNTSSSRAIPFNKMVESVQNDPFIPIAWQKHHSGMQGNEYLIDVKDIADAQSVWLSARDEAIVQAEMLSENEGITKQLCNRLLEPFMWTTMLITGSKEGWDNFHSLRCPQYQYTCEDGKVHHLKSKKEWRDMLGWCVDSEGHTWACPVENPKTDLDWLKLNKGQAEIHMMMLSEKIYDCIQESVPTQLKNEWHIPFEDKINELYPNLTLEDKIKVSVGMAANTSYTIVGDGSIITLEKTTRIHDKCKELNHSSVFEHCARAMSDEEYYSYVKGTVDAKIDADGFINIEGHTNLNVFGWCNNLKGFIPYRYFIDNKNM